MKHLAVSLLVLAACQDETIPVRPEPADDYNHAKLLAAVNTFIAAKSTPDAYQKLAQTVAQLRPGMDESVATEAERRMITLALDPIEALAKQSIAEQEKALALTVWPTLLEPEIEADQLDPIKDPRAADIPPKAGESGADYLLRLCSGPLTTTCKHVVPEWQGAIIDAVVLRLGTERARTAFDDCLECSGSGADPGWKNAVSGWETLDRAAAGWSTQAEAQADPGNWPIAGAASDDDPELPEAELTLRGDIVVDGHSYGPNQLRIDVLKELRGTNNDAIELHFHPEQTLAQVRAVLVDARKAGAQRVAVVAREPIYPYRRRVYWVADGSGLRANLRPSDSLSLLLHAIDEVAGPGTVARVD
ncbi:MAG TPA: hypothetical protein VGL61_24200 [Kofleriaceae bacterium]|jgi:hypothetical protein